jgi:hypothetical protein
MEDLEHIPPAPGLLTGDHAADGRVALCENRVDDAIELFANALEERCVPQTELITLHTWPNTRVGGSLLLFVEQDWPTWRA